ncbi:MAG: glycerol kinase GlpK [Planctomycetes bacterium]|nr:glycerol kinase GlpK [Planctomycetota bacterium]MCB9891978.1 glycerol kinase GlpK [Planctomycetota bacterium]MCB9919195.1 glycerol kinase GlpK [Planctomycetota bacterium]
MSYLLAVDQGTTGTRVFIFDESLRVVGSGYREFPQHYPYPGQVEHDVNEIRRSFHDSLTEALDRACGTPGFDVRRIEAIGVTNQRETVVLWDRELGQPLERAIVWQDRRTSRQCAEHHERGIATRVRELTGLPIDPYFSATKIAWLLDERGHRERAEQGHLVALTIDAFLVRELTGGEVFATDATNASRTMLMDLRTENWSDELCGLFRVPRSMLPRIVSSSEVVGTTKGVAGLPDGIPIAGIAGDQHAALFGQACFTPGDAKCTFGTGAFLLMNTADRIVRSEHGLITTLAWKLPNSTTYALEGSAFIAGAAVSWLRDGLGIIESASEVDDLAASVEDSGGVSFVPAFAGLGAPHWRPDARGIITGLTRGSTKAHVARAVLEGIALQNVDILRAMERDSGYELREVKVDGGAAASDLMMQFSSDVLGADIVRPAMLESTVIGAACLAGLATGVFADMETLRDKWVEAGRFRPGMEPSRVEEHLRRWEAAVARA